MRVERRIARARLAIFPDHPAKADLRSGKGNTDDDYRDHELPVERRSMSRNCRRKPPLLTDEKDHCQQCQDPDNNPKISALRIEPLLAISSFFKHHRHK